MLLTLVQTDRVKGLAGLTDMADSGHREAACHLAMYLSETTPTTAEAIEWLEKAAAFDYVPAAWNRAMVAHERLDPQAVLAWIDRAAELGSDDALLVQSHDYDVEAVLRRWRDDPGAPSEVVT
jgi:TPR repeat protein